MTEPLTAALMRVDSPGHGCALCQHVFGTLTDFDDHQVRKFGTDTPITCSDPRSMGLVTDHRGIWRTPEAVVNNARHAANLARPRSTEASERLAAPDEVRQLLGLQRADSESEGTGAPAHAITPAEAG